MLDLIVQTLDDTASTMATVFVMLFITGLMTEMGLFQRLSYLSKPLTSMSHLPAAAASTFMVSFGSTLAANTMIARLRDEGHLSERQAFFSAIMNGVPVYFRELFTYQLAFVVPILGICVGGVYAAVSISAGIIRLIMVMILGRAYLKADPESSPQMLESPVKKDLLDAAIKSLRGQSQIFIRMTALYFIMTFLVLYLSEEGIFQSLDVLPVAHFFGVPPATVIPITIYVASPKAGMTFLGPMIQNGNISEIQSLIVLMLGSMFMLPFYAVKSLMPNYTSVFGMRLGLSLVVVSTAINVLVRLLVLMLLMATV
ncbi:MAG: nucleoside recognition protein [Methanothrix sp.]|nr:nucleoside recognition protein [Methanothrix sp.]MDD4446470.1 nucleoside recognition protein [Methanothrix sp.]